MQLIGLYTSVFQYMFKHQFLTMKTILINFSTVLSIFKKEPPPNQRLDDSCMLCHYPCPNLIKRRKSAKILMSTWLLYLLLNVM